MPVRPTQFGRSVSLAAFLKGCGLGGNDFFIATGDWSNRQRVDVAIDDLDKMIAERYEMSTPVGMYDTNGAPTDIVVDAADGKPMVITAAYWHPTLRTFYVIFDRGRKRFCHLSVSDARQEIARPPSTRWHTMLLRRVRPTV